jgi:signal transduction histidine kinase
VELGLEVESDLLCFEVRDNGEGIPPEYLGTIFDKFQQIADQQRGKPNGTGLGLPISQAIVQHHGGRIWAESEVGTGTTFKFTVPRLAESARQGAILRTQSM